MLKTSERVSLGHSGKIADYIVSFILDRYLEKDPMTRYAMECQIKGKFVTLGGEVTNKAQFSPDDIAAFVRVAVNQIGYTKSYQWSWKPENTICGDELEVTQHISAQSPDIARGVNNGGWGDNAVCFGMAVNSPETNYMPRDWWLARAVCKHLYDIRYAGIDLKTMVTLDDGKVSEVVVSIPMNHRHFDYDIKTAVKGICGRDYEYPIRINGTGKFVQHGPVADCGTTGRKLAVDFYGSGCKIGGGCVDAETEYLAPDGWHKISDYRGGKVGQVDEMMNLSFVEPERYIQTTSNDVYELHMEHGPSMVLTDNHNVYYRTSKGNYHKKSLALLLESNEKASRGNHAEIPRFFRYDFNGGETKYSDAEAQLVIAHCADGTILKKDGKYNCRISVIRERKIERLRWILKRTGKEFSERVNSDGFTRFYFHLDNQSKLLSEQFANPDKRTAELLASEVYLWDGTENYKRFRTTHKEDADFMQFVLSGITGNVYSIYSTDKHEPGRAICYSVQRLNSRFCSPFRTSAHSKNEIRKLDSQNVYCFTVPTGLLLLRRKDYVFVTGNSPWTKDGTKADLSLNLLARACALSYIKHHPDFPEVHCAISCRIGSPEILVVYFDEHMNQLESCRANVSPEEVINQFSLREPKYAKLCRDGLFSCL